MVVVVSQPEIEYNGNFSWMNDGDSPDGWDLSEDTLKLSAIDFSFHKSNDSLYHVSIVKYSCGRGEEDALNRAEKIQYSVASFDSVLDIGSGFAIHRSSKYRIQHVEVQIHIPAGKKIRFDRTVREKLHGIDIDWRVNRNRSRNRRNDYIRNAFYLQSDVDYTMDVNGELTDGTGEPARRRNDNGDYRYNQRSIEDKKNDSIELKRSQEEKKQEPGTGKQESMDDEESVAASSPSHGLSPMAWF
jgi:hypothetical protein